MSLLQHPGCKCTMAPAGKRECKEAAGHLRSGQPCLLHLLLIHARIDDHLCSQYAINSSQSRSVPISMQKRELEHLRRSIAALTGSNGNLGSAASEPRAEAPIQNAQATAAMSFPLRTSSSSKPWQGAKPATPQQATPQGPATDQQQPTAVLAQHASDMCTPQQPYDPPQWANAPSSSASPSQSRIQQPNPRPSAESMGPLGSRSERTGTTIWPDITEYQTAEPSAAPAKQLFDSSQKGQDPTQWESDFPVALPSGLPAQGSPVKEQSQHEYYVTEPGSQDSHEEGGNGQDISRMPPLQQVPAAATGPICVYTETTVTRLVYAFIRSSVWAEALIIVMSLCTGAVSFCADALHVGNLKA